MAFNARTGQEPSGLPYRLADLGAAAMTYMLDGKQQVLIGSGTSLVAFALPDN